ncbi:MAG: hypothetical protein ACYCSS_06650 [Sulfuriferula sp.]
MKSGLPPRCDTSTPIDPVVNLLEENIDVGIRWARWRIHLWLRSP